MKCQMLYHVLRTCGGGEKNPLDKVEVVTDGMVWVIGRDILEDLIWKIFYFVIIPKIGLKRDLEKKNEIVFPKECFYLMKDH